MVVVQNHQIDQLKEEISGKDLALVKEHFDHMKVGPFLGPFFSVLCCGVPQLGSFLLAFFLSYVPPLGPKVTGCPPLDLFS